MPGFLHCFTFFPDLACSRFPSEKRAKTKIPWIYPVKTPQRGSIKVTKTFIKQAAWRSMLPWWGEN